MSKKFSIDKIRKYLKKEGFTINQKKNIGEKNNIDNIFRTFLSSLIIVSIFFTIPIIINFTKNEIAFSNHYENNSKNKLKTLLDNNEQKIDKDVNREFLFEDILTFNEQPADIVRLSAATIEELFKSTNYNLEDVRKNKLVKPISLRLLPNEIKKIENLKKKKIYSFKLFYH